MLTTKKAEGGDSKRTWFQTYKERKQEAGKLYIVIIESVKIIFHSIKLSIKLQHGRKEKNIIIIV